MATAEAHFSKPVEPALTGVTLELSVDEVQYLHDLLGSVGGRGWRRELNNGIDSAITFAVKGIKYTYRHDPDFPFETPLSIFVKE